MSSAPASQEIWHDAAWLAQALDPASRQLRLVRMDAEAYRAASFLDDRILQGAADVRYIPWVAVAAATPSQARRDARWIFHIGHVGSTLVARLLGELDGILAVREPRTLRDIALLPQPERPGFTGLISPLFSRTFGPGETALVKATSFVSEIAPELMGGTGAALFLFAQPRAYIEGILAGANSRQELHALYASRDLRMNGRVALPQVAEPQNAHLAAAAWACEMTALEAAAEAAGGQSVLWLDFDRMLQNISGALLRVAAFLDLPATKAQVQAIASGPLMRRYSKAPEYEYSPDLRRELLDEARRLHASEIDRALDLLNEAAEASPLLHRALARAATEN
jgi:hypothetical protein